jgi:hypothetical protein
MGKAHVDCNGYRILTKEERQNVYARALETYTKKVKRLTAKKADFCPGMCSHINAAVSHLRYDRYHAVYPSRNMYAWPEYHSYNPGYNQWSPFWMSRYFSENGHTKRIAILTALAEGKSRGD